MTTPLNASAITAGALISGSVFSIPPFQREYSWGEEEVGEFWSDLLGNLATDAYFLGLVILTDEESRKQVVDGQQRLITLTLFAAAIYHEAKRLDRKALADRIQADFLYFIDYETDEIAPRLQLADSTDNRVLLSLLKFGNPAEVRKELEREQLKSDIPNSFEQLQNALRKDIRSDPFKRLGAWADFITNKLYFAVFVHPDQSSAYQVFEVINTRGVELTTADLLKNYLLSQVADGLRQGLYENWMSVAKQIDAVNEVSFVQYIRHVVTSERGYVLPKDLYDFLAQRREFPSKEPIQPNRLMDSLNDNLDLYIQMMDPKLEGPAEPDALQIFSALNELSVIAIRPMLLSIVGTEDALEGMKFVLKFVVRRIVVSGLGTGNVERRLGEAANLIRQHGDWKVAATELTDLNPRRDEFVERLKSRSLNKRVLSFVRRSTLQKSLTPEPEGVLHIIRPKNIEIAEWRGFAPDEVSFLAGNIGNTFLTSDSRRSEQANDWNGFKNSMIPRGIHQEISGKLAQYDQWGAGEVREVAEALAEAAGDVWY